MPSIPQLEYVIALVGRPNVGKSTLFNVLTRSRDALVADYPGLTRDRKYGRVHFDASDARSADFIVVDTGGLSGESEELDTHMKRQTLLAVEESDVILFMVDARNGLTPADQVIAESLRRTGKIVKLVLNKIDGLDARTVAGEFFSLGLGEPLSIAASQNRGIQSMLSNVLETLELSVEENSDSSVDDLQDETDENSFEGTDENLDEDIKDKRVKVAIIGRPNVGKSTLVNRFLGEERVVVFDMPGTTRDSVFIPFERDGKKYTFIDTAGIRRKRAVHEVIEKFSIIKSMQAIERCNVVIMMIDARTEIADQD